MELIINKSKVSATSNSNENSQEFIPGGILNSNYQKVVRTTQKSVKPDSIFSIRNKVYNRLYFSNTSAETILKVAVFAILLAFII